MPSTAHLPFPHVKKIAVLRAGALGDFIVTLPALQALRAAYPAAEIILLTKPWLTSFLKDKRTPVDRTLEVPVYKGIRDEEQTAPDDKALERFFKQMREEQFDLAVSFQGKGVAANPFLKKLGARYTVGISSPEAAALDRSVSYYYYQSEVVRYLEVAALAGAGPVALEPEMQVLEKDLAEARAYLKQQELERFVVLHPCAMDVRRMWPEPCFAELADELVQKGHQVVFTGSAADEPAVSALMEQMQQQAVNACGALSLGGLAGLLSLADLVVSSDTGPLHVARAVGAKTVGIYWAPNLINWGPVTRATHRPVISWEMHCPACGTVPNQPHPFEPKTTGCDHAFSFVRDVSVAAVLEEAKKLLNF
ncbi:ADP-heptose:LPS heptosyltransferase [Pontibacter ummariensis]|uniref:ADP-heptose:LPS heptosyltransferase n=1 Tax=Pontibacter ummariensis TaxID=1610492 RepID=A0A239FF23_9BACT|nr:glycosyltransferase family 9 protein [Pontibacter ummariensis]PRY12278.1 ADP-heptose:LPS heptosyltransferase [Pontibacter ummariensis]SNS55630.1 ADP-heptose:LPS heptosyltransferase [Pontibacter ummariensis]